MQGSTQRLTVAITIAVTVLCYAASSEAMEPLDLTGACAGCHAIRAEQQSHPPLTRLDGRPAQWLYDRLLSYQRGEGNPTLMNRLTSGYSAAELRRLANAIGVGQVEAEHR